MYYFISSAHGFRAIGATSEGAGAVRSGAWKAEQQGRPEPHHGELQSSHPPAENENPCFWVEEIKVPF